MISTASFRSIIKSITVAMAACALFVPVLAQAEIKAGSVELSPFVGYSVFETKQNLKDRPVFGGRIGYNFTNRIGIEGVVDFTKTRIDDKQQAFTQEGEFTSPISRVEITKYHLDLLYHFMPEGRLNPFIAAGYGAAHYNPEINDKNMSIVNYGVGAKYWVAENVALRLDVRDNLIMDDKIHNLETTLGVVFRFGGKMIQPVQVAQAAPAPAPMPVVVKEEKVVILASEPKVEEKVLVAVAEPKVVILAFEDIHFDFDQSTLKPEAKTILKRNIQLLKDNPKTKIRIAGYTSALGTEDYNQQLSERRAEAVKAYLVEEGVIVSDRLSTIGYGDRNPAVYEAAPEELYSEAAKANMRVLFEIILQ
ncbi:MAG: OmpA family protein [Trichloromonadaceae bacterium]